MKYLYSAVILVYLGPILAQEEADTTTVDTSRVVTEEQGDTIQRGTPSAETPEDTVSMTLDSGYKGFPWGMDRDQMERYVTVDSAGMRHGEDRVIFTGTLAEDSVTFTYFFSDSGFWKVSIDYGSPGKKLEEYLGRFSRIEKFISKRYGSPRRTTQNEMGTEREYLFSDFPKLARAYFRSSWEVEDVRIELLLHAMVAREEEQVPVFADVVPILRLYYYHPDFYENVETKDARMPEKMILDAY
ncbi:MAG: hypothetical protein V3U24_02205 [Candidatus Neomarinimicrobiota bacterium]